jgi:hypothetical protein
LLLILLVYRLFAAAVIFALQYKLRVQPMSRAVAEGRAGSKAITYDSDSEQDEEGEGKPALLG